MHITVNGSTNEGSTYKETTDTTLETLVRAVFSLCGSTEKVRVIRWWQGWKGDEEHFLKNGTLGMGAAPVQVKTPRWERR